jgi:Glycosyltransferase sugar-binding region containing DXD motif
MIRSSRSDDEYNNNNTIQRPRRVQRLSSTNSTNSASTQQITYKNIRQQQQSHQLHGQSQQQRQLLLGGAPFRDLQQSVSNGSYITRSFLLVLFICIAIPGFMFLRSNDSYLYYDVTQTSSSSVRVFGPATAVSSKWAGDDHRVSYALYNRHDQRRFLESDNGGNACQKAIMKNNNHYYQKLIEQQQDNGPAAEDASSQRSNYNLLVQRFDQLPTNYGTELWKYCVLYTGIHNVFWDMENLVSMQLIDDILVGPISDTVSKSQEEDADGSTKSKRNLSTAYVTDNIVIRVDGALAPDQQKQSVIDQEQTSTVDNGRLHHSFLKLSKPNSKVALGMMLYLLDYDGSTSSTPMVPLDTLSLQQTLSMLVTNDQVKKRGGTWNFWTAKCNEPPFLVGSSMYEQFSRLTNHMVDVPCLAEAGEPCCQVWTSTTTTGTKSITEAISSNPPSLLLHHSNVINIHQGQASTSGRVSSSLSRNPLPLNLQNVRPDDITDEDLGMSKAHLQYIATVREYRTNVTPATKQETPNYFDILLHNNCLPHDKECFKCLQSGYHQRDVGDCTACHDKCSCYCDALCNVRPPAKRLAAEWVVTTPRYRKNPERLVPRIIHQTWFEPVTKEKYPNMSRLIESFRKSGWEYEFYDDDKAAQFLSVHFPPAVREAYDSLIPGAFKADLFRYCVLLIRGGLYADMDILLESNLDAAIPPDVGFLAPQDSPGESIGHRSCLWNGLMAVAPGHPVLAQTIQNVVNNVRNRFTSVDYDDMLCPNPVLSVSHTVDTLFTCGPCIVGGKSVQSKTETFTIIVPHLFAIAAQFCVQISFT